MIPAITVRESPDAQIREVLLNLMMTYNESKTGPRASRCLP